MTTTDPFTEAARKSAEWYRGPRLYVGTEPDREATAHIAGWEAARTHLAAQEESVLMTSREETISDRLSDAGYTEYAEDEDGGVTWVSAPLGEVLRIVSAAQEPTDAEVGAAQKCLYERTLTWVPTVEVRAALSAARATRRDEEKRDG